MKKGFFLFMFIAAVTAGCNNDTSDGTGTGPRSTDEDTTATNVQSVENVNGNIPDTTNSINLGPDAKDTSAKKDSVK